MAMQHLRGELKRHYPLTRHTSWRVGGVADRCYFPYDLADLQCFLQQLPEKEPLTWLGLGSNVLLRDGGLPGTVILTLNRLQQMNLLPDGMVYVEAGVTCAKLAKFCVRHGFEAAAFFAGIPGTVGGALAMNAGAFGGETWQHVYAVKLLDRQGILTERPAREFEVGYRHVLRPATQFFAAALLQFQVGDANQAKQQLSALLRKRNVSQPIGTYSCGSVFRNPVGDYAGRLIEQAGLKGYCLGDACVSDKHANFILNRGSASALSIEMLLNQVKERVYQQFGVMLVPEVQIMGRYGPSR